jgi:hypothetical protein
VTDSLVRAARRHAHAIPGHLLVAAEPCAIPASVLTVDVLAERATDLGVAERYTLRAISTGLDRPEEISWFLGLDRVDTANVIGSLLQLEMIDYRAVDTEQRNIQLLPAGRDAVDGVVAAAPKVVTLSVMFDRITRKPVPWTKRSLTREWDARNTEGLIRLLPVSGEPVTIDELSPSSLSPILAGKNQVNRILGALGVTENRRYFKEATLLIYRGIDNDSVRLGIDIEGVWSADHEVVLEQMGVTERLGIRVDGPQPLPQSEVSSHFPEPAKKLGRDEVLRLQALADSSGQAADGAAAGNGTNLEASTTIESAAVRWLGTYEHPLVLDEALTKSRRRVLIISPWITSAVVTKQWIRQVEKLARTCPVTIAWGYEDNPKIDSALAGLHAAAARKNQLAVVRLKNTHAKVLVGDEFYITTSFNWLSFRGDSSRRYRMEEGTLIRDRGLADQAYERYLDQIRQQAIEVVGDLPDPRGASAFGAAPSVTPKKATTRARNRREGVERTSGARKQLRTPGAEDWSKLQVGSTILGTVKSFTDFGVFVSLGNGIDGLIHNSRLPRAMKGNQRKKLEVGQRVSVKILEVQPERNRVSLGIG